MNVITLGALIIAVVVNLVISTLIADSYRSNIRRLMGMAPAISDSSVEQLAESPLAEETIPGEERQEQSLSLGELLGREQRFWWTLCGLSMALGLICSLAWFLSLGTGWKPLAWILFGLAMATPGFVLQMELMRWTLGKQIIASFSWLATLLLLMLVAGAEGGAVLFILLPMVVIPFVLFHLLFGIPGLRGIAPFLITPVFTIIFLALLGQELLTGVIGSGGSPSLRWLVGTLGAVGVFLLFSLMPVVAGGISVAHRLSHHLGSMYERKSYSDLVYLYGSAWIIITLIYTSVNWQASPGFVALLPLIGWGIIPLFFVRFSHEWFNIPDKEAPLLLVLRVFQRSRPSGWLFDHLVQRWRFIGPVALISGTDLATRALEPHLLISFLEGHLQHSYIKDKGNIREAVAEIDSGQDHDGRFRIREFFCYATTWESTLIALLDRSSCVVMDLRDFGVNNKGCRFELQEIAEARHLRNVVILSNKGTDINLIDAITAKVKRRTTKIHKVSADADRLEDTTKVLQSLLA